MRVADSVHHGSLQSLLDDIYRQMKEQEEKTAKLEARVQVLEEMCAVRNNKCNNSNTAIDE